MPRERCVHNLFENDLFFDAVIGSEYGRIVHCGGGAWVW